ncbi:MAG: MBL fold metallo-hydrolase [Planctomycetes bacterium]|nr:MBL fold metallo-hydrolase [Planctomycetota bacterium]
MSTITPAASVMLTRDPGSRSIYAILRGSQLRFFGGFWAFPGGKLTETEAADTDALPARRLAACRELFEETGVLVARTPDGQFPRIDDEMSRCRKAILDEHLAFEQFLAQRSLTIRPGDFACVGEITTPAFAQLRYATTFFVAHLPNGQEATIWPGELERGEWLDSADLLGRWRRSEVLLTPPSAMSLMGLGDRPIGDAPALLGPLFENLARGAIHPILFAPDVQLIPLKTVALPPSNYTNAYLVGSGPRYLIDPGCHEPAEQQRLFDVIDAGQPPTAIVLTHHHPDHIGAAEACARRYRIPIWAHARTAEKLASLVDVQRFLNDGDRLDLGPSPAHAGPWRLEALFTPGHASGHLAFFEPFYRLLFAGDMISTLSSMVIAPPDGHLGDYLKSLRRLRELPARLLLPSHGNVSARLIEVIDAALAHRVKRETQLLEALGSGPIGIDELTQQMYRGTPEPLMRFARAQVLAGLLKLQAEGRAHPADAERWQA